MDGGQRKGSRLTSLMGFCSGGVEILFKERC